MCAEIENDPAIRNVDVSQTFLWDNLSSHLSPLLYNTVEHQDGNTTFKIVRWPPYQAKFWPTEYVLCYTAAMLQQQVCPHWSQADLCQNLMEVFSILGRNGGSTASFNIAGTRK